MTTETRLPATTQGTPERRELALLKAIGLDKADPAQRELALAIADRYGLDLMLKHLVLVEGRPYLTRDGLLHIAHRSGQLDGIEVTVPELEAGFWRASCTVWRKDMSRGFTYAGRYPEKGGNARFAPEMATKVAESMALRRAFDVSAPAADERWDVDPSPIAAQPAPSLADRARAMAAQTAQEPPSAPEADEVEAEAVELPPEPQKPVRCPSVSESGEQCGKAAGHPKNHQNHSGESWAS